MRLALLAGLVAGILAVGLPAFAATTVTPKKTNTNRNTNTNNRNNRNNTANTQPATPANSAASQELVTLRSAYDKADTACSDLIAKLTKDFEATPDMAAALSALKDATDKLNTAKAPVIEKVKASAAYQKALADHEDAANALDKLRNDGADDAQIQAAALKVFEFDAASDKMMADAFAASPDVVAAQAVFNAAQTKVNQMRADFRKSLDTNTDVANAKSARDDAQKALVAAQQRLASK